jgi:phosphate/sulfate permease
VEIDAYLIAVVILIAFAIFDLIVGVSNDAVNFLNSSIGSRVAPRYIIMVIASFGIMAGVTFSSGMMEVARKGIFHPQFFTMPDLMTIFLAVMLTDVILLDLFSTFGLPTSTTVSIVFELLGAAVAVSVLKIMQESGSLISVLQYINTAKAMIIILGILISIGVAFVCGAIVQVLSRLLFGFNYMKRLAKYGALWGGVALSSIIYFILIKGAKGATFITPERADWINSHTLLILLACFVVSAVLLQVLLLLRINILKPIVLVGTFALAMAFAANDLVNFIGVPMAGLQAYAVASASGDPLGISMTALGDRVQPVGYLLLLAGVIMVITLWRSRKARTVVETTVNLSQQEEGEERFDSSPVSRVVVRMVIAIFEWTKPLVPKAVRKRVSRRLDPTRLEGYDEDDDVRPSFDLLRASVNLMVASAVISYATSQKLPLSTTYVTFMTAMGTSFADQAWGRESAVYRVTGVLTVVGGWFMTAIMAFTITAVFAAVIFYGKAFGVAALLLGGAAIVWKNHRRHGERIRFAEDQKVFNLKKVVNAPETISITFEHVSYLLQEIRESLNASLDALLTQYEYRLRLERNTTKQVQRWANIIIANIFKSLRLLQVEEVSKSFRYAQTIRRVQKLADGHRDIVMRSYDHVRNQHKGLLDVQAGELRKVQAILSDILLDVEKAFRRRQTVAYSTVAEKDRKLRELAASLNQEQIGRIADRTSKTRLSILFYAIVGNAMMLSKQCLKLLEIFDESFGNSEKTDEFDME